MQLIGEQQQPVSSGREEEVAADGPPHPESGCPPPTPGQFHTPTLLTLQAASASPALVLEECSLHECEAEQLDVEMAGGMAASAAQSIPIQLMLLRRVLGGDTVGVKRR